MTINWRVFLTPEFFIGVVVIGLLVNVVSAYVVRSLDWVVEVLPASFRRAQEAETARIQRLTEAATADHAIYAALTAETSRLRSHQYAQFFLSLVCFSTMVLFAYFVQTGEIERIVGVSFAIFLTVIGFYQYMGGLDSARRAQRLDKVLREVQRNLKLPVMD